MRLPVDRRSIPSTKENRIVFGNYNNIEISDIRSGRRTDRIVLTRNEKFILKLNLGTCPLLSKLQPINVNAVNGEFLPTLGIGGTLHLHFHNLNKCYENLTIL